MSRTARFLRILVLTAAMSAAHTSTLAQTAAPPAGVLPVAPAKLEPTALAAAFDEYLRAHAAQNGFMGTVLVARAGKPLLSKGYGFANVEWQIPNAPDTKFRIGSLTKQFTSMLIMQLREQGKLALEHSLCVYLEPCPEAWKPVSLHHLLTHTSGIPTYTGLADWRKVNMVPHTIDQMIGFFRNLPLQWKPGDQYAYNNSGYFLLGVIVEKVTGKKYEEALREMILAPLGMNDTGYDWTKTIIPKRASGYMGVGAAIANAAALDMQQPYSAGALYSTVEDLLKWDQALYTTTLLPDAAKQVMWTPFRNNYAYGWNIRTPSEASYGHTWLAHSGGINGFSAMIIRVPDAKLTVIVLSNNATVAAGAVANDLLALYFGKAPTKPAK
jgi:CubicO group peptidase (beta-lactamase class C family)